MNWDESELDDEYDVDNEFDEETFNCVECGRELFEDSEMCPQCGCFVTDEYRGTNSKSRIKKQIIVLILVLTLLLPILIGFFSVLSMN